MTPENSMTDNVLQTLQHLIQDVIAPDVRELKVRLAGFEKLVDERFNSVDERLNSSAKSIDERFNSLTRSIDERFNAQAKQSEVQFQALLSAISEAKAQTELARTREISDLRERIAVIESKLAAKAS
jgi:hypothetical protein